MELNIRQKKVIQAKENKILCLAAAGSGKAVPNSTKIPTPEGWKRVDEIKVGDYLFDRNGNKTKVMGVYPQGEKDVYEITFSDGRIAQCSKDHLWNIGVNDKNNFKTMSIDDFLKNYTISENNHFYIQSNGSIKDYLCECNTSYDEYIIGLFLYLNQGLGIEADYIIDDVLSTQEEYKNIRTSEPELINDIFCYIKDEAFIHNLKYLPINKRFALMQGLLDAGSNFRIIEDKYSLRFYCINDNLERLFIDIARSLGYICRKVESHNIVIENPDREEMFRLPEKRRILKDFIEKNTYIDNVIEIISIEKLACKEEMTCFYVDNKEHLFLMNDFIVTHNTTVLTERVKYIIDNCNVKPEEVACISFTNMAADEMKKRLGDKYKGAFIGTMHSLANNICIESGINTEKYIIDAEFDRLIEKALTLPMKYYPKIKHLLIDEFQDMCDRDMKFINKINAPNFFAVGDERQAIYSFRGSSLNHLYDLYADPTCTKYYLTINYRCSPNIVDLSNDIVGSMHKVSPAAESAKIKNGVINTKTNFTEAVEEMMWDKDYGNWAVICRTNNELATAVAKLEKLNIPCVSFKKGDLELLEMEAILRDDRVKVLTIHTAKGLEFKKVIVVGARSYTEEERRIKYVAITRAEQYLYMCPSICGRGYKNAPANRDVAMSGRFFDKVKTDMISF